MSIIKDNLNKYTYAMAIWTDKADFIIDKRVDIDESKLLEIRCFDEKGEFRAFRSVTGEEFKTREMTDDEKYADGFYDEAQYLDIDTGKTPKNHSVIYATGGGKYHLPKGMENKKMLLTRTYYKFDEDGVAHKYDWRLVGFTDAETVGKGEK